MYLGMDGTGGAECATSRSLLIVAGKQADGSAKTREAKLVNHLDGGIAR